MTDNDDVWLEVARRAAVSRFSGATADDDDVLNRADLGEALLNPNRQSGGAGNLGGQGMMPPMMMGGMGRGGGGGDTGAPPTLGGAAAGGMAPPANPMQAAANIPMASVTPLQSSAGPAGAGAEEPELPDLGSGMPGGGMPGGAPGGELGAGGEDLGQAGAGGAVPGGPAPDGFSADPTVVREFGAKWAEVAQEMHRYVAPTEDASLGVAVAAERPLQALEQATSMWIAGAAAEFDSLVTRLHDVAGQYEAVEEAGVAEAKMGGTQ